MTSWEFGGATAAIVATLGVAGMGGPTALIEIDRLGGDCLWTGRVPSKALLSAAHTMRTADRYGLEPAPPTVDLRRVMASVRDAQEVIEPQDSPERLRAEGVEVIEGWGRLDGPGRIRVGDRVVHYRAALIATGSSPAPPPIPGLDAAINVYTNDTIWGLDELPARFTVLGGGPIGCELAQAFSRLGSAVTVVEALPTLLPRESAEVGEFLATRLAAEGVNVRTGVRADSVGGQAGEGVETGGTVHLDDGTTVDFEALLVAVGRRPRTSDLELGTVGVDLDGAGNVVVDDMMRTTADRIYAAGDVTGQMPFTHVAAHEARAVVTNAMFRARRSVDYDQIPWVTFTDPEVVRVGLDARAAREQWGSSALVQRYDYAELDRAVTDRSREGWVELVGDLKRRLVGATTVGRAAGESIAELVAWIVAGRKVDAISTTTHAYPTFSEGQSRAADDVLRARYFSPRLRRVTEPLLRLLRRTDAA